MRLTQEQIEVIAYRVIHDLQRDGLLAVNDMTDAEIRVQTTIVDDLLVEDRLNDEVRDIMRLHDHEIRRADVEHHQVFKAIKARLAEERNIIL